MNYNKAFDIFSQIEKTELSSLKTDLLNSAIRYSNLRVSWIFADTEARIEMDNERTIAHNVFIDCCNILNRNMMKIGEDNTWRLKLGNERKTIGDFACYLNCILGIEAR